MDVNSVKPAVREADKSASATLESVKVSKASSEVSVSDTGASEAYDSTSTAPAERVEQPPSASIDEVVAQTKSETTIQFDIQAQKENGTLLSFKIVDQETGRVIRQFPPNELPDLLTKAHAGLDKRESILLDLLA